MKVNVNIKAIIYSAVVTIIYVLLFHVVNSFENVADSIVEFVITIYYKILGFAMLIGIFFYPLSLFILLLIGWFLLFLFFKNIETIKKVIERKLKKRNTNKKATIIVTIVVMVFYVLYSSLSYYGKSLAIGNYRTAFIETTVVKLLVWLLLFLFFRWLFKKREQNKSTSQL